MNELRINRFKMEFPEYTLTTDDFTVKPGELLSVKAPSGFGKTTLLRGLMGLTKLTEGEMSLKGRRLDLLPAHERNVGVVFQDYLLFPNLTAIENALFGLKIRKKLSVEAKKKAEAAFHSLGLEKRANAPIAELSGGERQRVALIRALLFEPDWLILDEPLKGLDPEGITRSVSFLRQFLLTNPVPVIWVSHQGDDPIQGASIIGTEQPGRGKSDRHFKYNSSESKTN